MQVTRKKEFSDQEVLLIWEELQVQEEEEGLIKVKGRAKNIEDLTKLGYLCTKIRGKTITTLAQELKPRPVGWPEVGKLRPLRQEDRLLEWCHRGLLRLRLLINLCLLVRLTKLEEEEEEE